MADVFTKEKRSEIMGRIRSKNTGLEKDARKMLRKHGIRYRSHPKAYGSPDFLLEGRLLLFCDGSFWHGRDWKRLERKLAAGSNPDYWVKHIGNNRRRDREVNRTLRKQGRAVVRLWDSDIRKRPEWCAARIREALDREQRIRAFSGARLSVNKVNSRGSRTKHVMKRENALPLVDLFSGMGCASMGFKEAGFEPVAALEIDPARCELYRANVGIDPARADIMDVSGKDLLRAGGLRKRGRFCVVGCPPCQSFSSLAGTRGANRMLDVRSGYVRKFARLVVEMMPLAVVFENVQGMMGGAGRKFFDEYKDILDGAGYRTRHRVINAADFGVPQNRKRVIAVSIRRSAAKKKTMDGIYGFLCSKVAKKSTVRNAIGYLDSAKPLESGESDPEDQHHRASLHRPSVLKMIRNVPKDGGSRRDLPRRMWLECHKKIGGGAATSYGRMSWDAPSPTLTCRCTTPACGRFTHPAQDRGITVREAARLQTIPDDANLTGYAQKDAAIIGDAVPVLLARRIAEMLRDAVA